MVVAVEEKDYRWIFHLDDSSGSNIEVTCPKERPPLQATISAAPTAPTNNEALRNNSMARTLCGNAIDMSDIDLGSVVKVKGGISEFRGEKQITLERFELIRSTTDEAAAWREMHEFRANILSKPWYIPSDGEQRLKEEADGTKAQAEEKVRRKAEKEAKEEKRKAQREEKERRKKKRAEREALRPEGISKRRTNDKENVAT
ncbi:hypothetical protein MMC30_001214 [Trapelia coarctata]|nr:hypothetical protein [Trapelia coarctata]